jgi:hypothetical protein
MKSAWLRIHPAARPRATDYREADLPKRGLIKLEAREVRLLGLDMPTKAAVTDPDGNGIPRRERIKEAVAAAHTAKPGLLVFGSIHW